MPLEDADRTRRIASSVLVASQVFGSMQFPELCASAAPTITEVNVARTPNSRAETTPRRA